VNHSRDTISLLVSGEQQQIGVALKGSSSSHHRTPLHRSTKCKILKIYTRRKAKRSRGVPQRLDGDRGRLHGLRFDCLSTFRFVPSFDKHERHARSFFFARCSLFVIERGYLCFCRSFLGSKSWVKNATRMLRRRGKFTLVI